MDLVGEDPGLTKEGGVGRGSGGDVDGVGDILRGAALDIVKPSGHASRDTEGAVSGGKTSFRCFQAL